MKLLFSVQFIHYIQGSSLCILKPPICVPRRASLVETPIFAHYTLILPLLMQVSLLSGILEIFWPGVIIIAWFTVKENHIDIFICYMIEGIGY